MTPLRKSFLLTLIGLALVASILWWSWATGASEEAYASGTESLPAPAYEEIPAPGMETLEEDPPGDAPGPPWMQAASAAPVGAEIAPRCEPAISAWETGMDQVARGPGL